MSRAHRVFMIGTLVLVAIGVVILSVSGPGKGPAHVGIGTLLGTFFGQCQVAASWAVLGPFRAIYRIPLSICWIALLFIGLSHGLKDGPWMGLIRTLLACAVVQWVLTQPSLWLVKFFWRVDLRIEVNSEHLDGAAHRQFGIRQLMMCTAIIAVVLGIGRATLLSLPPQLNFQRHHLAFVYLTIAAIIMNVPLLISLTLRHFYLRANILIIGLICLATWWEVPILNSLAGNGPRIYQVIWINLFTSAWVFAFALLARLSGFTLSSTIRSESLVASTLLP